MTPSSRRKHDEVSITETGPGNRRSLQWIPGKWPVSAESVPLSERKQSRNEGIVAFGLVSENLAQGNGDSFGILAGGSTVSGNTAAPKQSRFRVRQPALSRRRAKGSANALVARSVLFTRLRDQARAAVRVTSFQTPESFAAELSIFGGGE